MTSALDHFLQLSRDDVRARAVAEAQHAGATWRTLERVLESNGCERVGELGDAATVWAVHLGIVRRGRAHSVTGPTSASHQPASHVTARAS